MPTEDDFAGQLLRGDSESLMKKPFRMPLDVPAERIRPLGDRLVIRIEDEEPETIGLLHLPDMVDMRLRKAVVLRNAKGPRPNCPPIAVGTKVIYHEFGGSEFETTTGLVRIIRHQDVLAQM